MRLYTFCNYYLSSIQQGIQSAHVVHELFNKYRNEFSTGHIKHDQDQQLVAWSSSHKTMVVLNGGNAETLRELHQFMDVEENTFAWNCFFEDAQSLDSSMTCVGIILPERIYEASAAVRQRGSKWKKGRDDILYTLEVPDGKNMSIAYEFGPFTEWEKELIERLGTFGLAR